MKKSLGLWASLALICGSMLGIGIFIGPPQTAASVNSVYLYFGLWVLGGLSALAGAISLAELGAMMPVSGGDYAYLRLAYGPGIAFATGWLQVLVIFPGSLATMAVATSAFQVPVLMGTVSGYEYSFLGISVSQEIIWAVGIIIFLTVLNHIGIVISGTVQFLLTIIPVVLLTLIGIWLVFFTPAQVQSLGHSAIISNGSSDFQNLAAGYLPVYFAFAGWYAVLYIGKEVRRPERYLPWSIILGTLIVTCMYMLICWSYVTVFPLSRLAEVGEAGTATAGHLFGSRGSYLMTALIFFAMLSSINGTILTGSRIAFAMSKNRDFPSIGGKLDKRFKTPVTALWIQSLIALVLCLAGRADQLLNYTTCAMLISGTLLVLAIIILRNRMPDVNRPYRAWAYPFSPLFFMVSSILVLLILIYNQDVSVLAAILWFGLAYAFYRVFLAKKDNIKGEGNEIISE